jgi:hypothetical protein
MISISSSTGLGTFLLLSNLSLSFSSHFTSFSLFYNFPIPFLTSFPMATGSRQPGQDREKRMGQNMTARTRKLGQDNRDRKTLTEITIAGKPRQDSWDISA